MFIFRSVVQKNEMVKFVVPQKYYQPYLAKKSKKGQVKKITSNR